MTLQNDSAVAKVAPCSFAYFVYPFLFDSEAFPARVEAVERASINGIPAWKKHEFAHEDLMPHVAQYLNVDDATGVLPSASRMWKLNDDLQEVFGLDRSANWTLTAQGGRTEVPFWLGKVGGGKIAAHLTLFDVGVGLLTVQAAPKSDALNDWLDFLHYFRIGDGKRDVRLRAEKRTGKDQTAPFFPAPAGGIDAHPDGSGLLRDLLQALLHTGDTEAGTVWWKEVFVGGRVLPFFGLYVDGLESEREQAELRYRLRHFFKSGQEIIPSASDLRDDHSSLLPYADKQWFVFSIEGGGFLACDAPTDSDFFRTQMPGHLRQDYFLGFLLALHQRFALIGMSDQVARHWPRAGGGDDAGREKTFGRIRDTLLAFTARGYFAQVMQRDNHHACYQKWQEVFQLDRLYQEVRDEVREMHEYLRMKQAARMQELQESQKRQLELTAREEARREREAQRRRVEEEKRTEDLSLLIGSVGLGVAVPALTFGFLSINIQGYNLVVRTAAYIAAGTVVVSILIILSVWFGIRKRRRQRRQSSAHASDAERSGST